MGLTNEAMRGHPIDPDVGSVGQVSELAPANAAVDIANKARRRHP